MRQDKDESIRGSPTFGQTKQDVQERQHSRSQGLGFSTWAPCMMGETPWSPIMPMGMLSDTRGSPPR